MELTAAQTATLRARLASRKSLFGGSLSTAVASKASDYVPAKERFVDTIVNRRVSDKVPSPKEKSPSQSLPKDGPARPAGWLAFDHLTSESGRGGLKASSSASKDSKGKRNTKDLPSKACIASASKLSSSTSEKAIIKPSGTQKWQYTSNVVPATKQSGYKAITSPTSKGKKGKYKSKKGQAGRKDAVAPQAVGGPTRSQKASKAWAEQMTKLRGDASQSSQSHKTMPGWELNSGEAAAAKSSDTAKKTFTSKDLSRLPEWQRKILEKKEERGQKRRREEEEADDDSDLDDFVVKDEQGEASWREEMKSITGYDPSKFDDGRLDDRAMEADWRSIQAEESRSRRLGRSEDERAEAEELARLKAKAARKPAGKQPAGMMM